MDAWFGERGHAPFPFQTRCWNAYLRGEDALVHAATGTGKTLAVGLGPMIEALAEGGPGRGIARTRILWITPLRALAADTEQALRAPAEALGLNWTIETRTGDTSDAMRRKQSRRLPTVLVTTPESLSLLLTRADVREQLADLRALVVDEWHELLGGKRGVLVELAAARLRTWTPKLRTWGLSATLGNLEQALEVLVGARRRHAKLIQGELKKNYVIQSVTPPEIERFPWSGHLGLKLLPSVVEAVERAGTSLLFTNTRSQAEAWYRALLEAKLEWAGELALHHGSIDQKARRWVERGLRAGELRAVVSTSSLDLGVDFSPVDQVLQIGSPKGVARLVQRAGRSGHSPGRPSSVTCVPTHAFELVEAAAARDGFRAGRIESREPVENPIDVLVQHLVTASISDGFEEEALKREVRSTYAFRSLSDADWDWALRFAAEGGVLNAYPEYRRLEEQNGRYRPVDDRVVKRHRLSIGVIVGDASLTVQYLKGGRLGSIEEHFISRLSPGDRFAFAGKTLELVRVRDMTAWVRRAPEKGGPVPRWMGGKMPLSSELAEAVRGKLEEARRGVYRGAEMRAVRPILELQQERSAIPAPDELLIESVQTREGFHLFLFPFAGRLVHEGLAPLLAFRMAQIAPTSFSFSVNDYGIELLSPTPAPLEEALGQGLFSTERLADDVLASMNSSEMAKRQFREIARVAGLVFQGYPGKGKTARQLQASSGLLYDVFARHDPKNLLYRQAARELLERELDLARLTDTLRRIETEHLLVRPVEKPTPLAFPLLVDRLRARLSSEKLSERVRRMQLQFEKAG